MLNCLCHKSNRCDFNLELICFCITMWSWSILVIVTIQSEATKDTEVLKEYKDVFLPGKSGKPTFGSTMTTCWARGGVCIDIRYCTTMKYDTDIAGCTRGYKVCCKNYKLGSPTVGVNRKSGEILVFSADLQELNLNSVRLLALINANNLKGQS